MKLNLHCFIHCKSSIYQVLGDDVQWNTISNFYNEDGDDYDDDDVNDDEDDNKYDKLNLIDVS